MKPTRRNPPQSAAICRKLPQDAAICGLNTNTNTKENTNTNTKEKESARATRFTPPTIEAVQSFVSEHGYSVDAGRFVDYYESNGWKVGKNPMKDWQAAVRSWHRKATEEGGHLPPANIREQGGGANPEDWYK